VLRCPEKPCANRNQLSVDEWLSPLGRVPSLETAKPRLRTILSAQEWRQIANDLFDEPSKAILPQLSNISLHHVVDSIWHCDHGVNAVRVNAERQMGIFRKAVIIFGRRQREKIPDAVDR
jgi:hypothetical protein